MDYGFFVSGLILGFVMATPVGPVGVLCLRRTLSKGRLVGLVSGLGAATADALYGFFAAFGISFISHLLTDLQIWFRLLGSSFLLYLGIKAFRAKPLRNISDSNNKGLLNAYLTTFLITVTNPVTLFAFMAAFAWLGVASVGRSYIAAGELVLGVFLGSSFWWVLISAGIGNFRHKFNHNGIWWLNKISGVMLIVFGLLALFGIKM